MGVEDDEMDEARKQKVGPWTLHECLGRGGNATVWTATRPGEERPAALKIINVKKVEREPYQRFVREIEFLREHEGVDGLLPLVDANLPDAPSKSDQPWLAMPVATPIGDALSGRPLSDVVGAVSAVAETLFRLQRDFNIAHRDVKPGNLYELNGSWLIGDFGLVALPDAEGLTSEGRPLGPTHYTAYEMILDPSKADPHSADVYSLGKTLWVLATDQGFPPEGHQPAGMRGFEIGDFRPHARSVALDLEIDLMTRVHAEERPSKEQVARDLVAWQQLSSEPVVLDMSKARVRLREKLETAIAEQDTLEQQKELAYAAVRRLQVLSSPLNDGLKNLYGRTQIDSSTDKLTDNMLRTHGHWGGPQVVFRWHRCTLVAPSDRPVSTMLRMSRSLELIDNGDLVLHLMVHVGPEGVLGSSFNWHPEARSAPVGSIEAEKMLDDGVTELAEAVREGAEVFVDELPEQDSS
jgi:serine/threonine protein kinase